MKIEQIPTYGPIHMAGHEGLGVTTAPATAQLFLDLFLKRVPRIDAGPYSPLRSVAWAT